MIERRRKSTVPETIKPYVQFSKKIIRFCILNLIIIEAFVMYMIFVTKDTAVLPYLITSLAVQFLGCVIWYLKNSEAEKKSRIEAEMERMRLVSNNTAKEVINNVKDVVNPEAEPDTFYKGDEGNIGCTTVNTDILPPSSHSYQSSFNSNNDEDDSVG